MPNINYVKQDIVKEENEEYISNPQYNTILNYINKNESITRSEAQEVLSVGQTRAIYILKQIVNENLIKTVGKGKRTMYNKILMRLH